MTFNPIRTIVPLSLLASILSFSACSDSSSAKDEDQEEQEEHEGHESHSHHSDSSEGLTLGDDDIQDGFIYLHDTTITGVLTVSTTSSGPTVLKNVEVTGNLLIKRSGRVDFSGSADVVHVGSSNTDVFAFDDEAQVNGHHFMGQNNTFTTKSFADYQTVDWTEKTIDLSTGIRLAYTVTGDEKATPVVLIHGLTDGRVSWSQVAPALAKKGYRVYVPEYRGNGKTDKPIEESAYTLSELSSDIVAFISEVGIKKPHIVGHSLGAFIAQELAISYADKISSITLIGSGVSVDEKNETIDWLVNGTGDDSFDGIYAYDSTQKLPEDFLKAWAYNTNPDEDFQAANLEHLRQVPYYAWKYLVKNLLKIDNSKRLSSIESDVQIIWGSKDAIFNKKAQDALQKGLSKANSVVFHEVEGADHNTHWGSEKDLKTVVGYIDEFVQDIK
ncbi:MAG: alpha/beta hydrolase [Fibrobacter sp.]|nr:alpha/beta hydrolase [Fibrobacter sp.]